VPIRRDRNLELGADAVGGGDQNGIAIASRLEIEERSESAECGVGTGSARCAGEGLDRIDERVTGIDVDACVPVRPAGNRFLAWVRGGIS